MLRSAVLRSGVLLASVSCGGEDVGGADGDGMLRRKLDAYLRQSALEDSARCLCEGGSSDECEVADVTSEDTRDCYVNEASADAENTAAFFDCVTPIIQRHTECVNALESCDDDGYDDCEDAYLEMLQCPAPSRDVLRAWDECEEL